MGTTGRRQLFRIGLDRALETITVLEESVVEGARVPSYLIRYEDGRRARVSVGLHWPTPREAWQAYLDGLVEALDNERSHLRGIGERIQDLLRGLGPAVSGLTAADSSSGA